jgi:hypothetical protein
MTVKEAETEMNSRKRLGGGKPKQYYNKLASKAHQHRSAFDVFPSTNEYVSIFCGSIKTLIKVCRQPEWRDFRYFLTDSLGVSKLY